MGATTTEPVGEATREADAIEATQRAIAEKAKALDEAFAKEYRALCSRYGRQVGFRYEPFVERVR